MVSLHPKHPTPMRQAESATGGWKFISFHPGITEDHVFQETEIPVVLFDGVISIFHGAFVQRGENF